MAFGCRPHFGFHLAKELFKTLLNGVKMVNGTDVTVTSGTSIVFASALANGDVVDIVAFGTFNVAAINAKAEGDTSTLETEVVEMERASEKVMLLLDKIAS